MKKVLSICLIILILFNTLGFYGLFVGMRYKVKYDLVKRLNKDNYNEKETVTIKVPLAIPYHVDKKTYERVDGEVEHNGEFYRLVKQKLENDTLFIVCIKDNASKRIKKALSDYVKTFTDKPVQAKHSGKTTLSFMKDYMPSSCKLSSASKGWSYSIQSGVRLDFFYQRSGVIDSPPPKG